MNADTDVNKYIHFTENTPPGLKTRVFECHNNRSGAILGLVKWYGPWRQYCFFTEAAIFNADCLKYIGGFLNIMNALHKHGKS